MLDKLDLRIRIVIGILTSHLIGVPVLYSYLHLLVTFLSPATMSGTFLGGVVVGIIFIIAVFQVIHIYVAFQALRPLIQFFSNPKSASGDRAIKSLITAPFIIGAFSMFNWAVGSFLIVFLLSRLAPLPFDELFIILIAGVCAGVFVVLFSFYSMRLILGAERTKLAHLYPGYWKSEDNRPRFGVRYGILISSILLVFASLLLAGLIAYSEASIALLRKVGNDDMRKLNIITRDLRKYLRGVDFSESEFHDIVPGEYFDGTYVINQEGKVLFEKGINLPDGIKSSVRFSWLGEGSYETKNIMISYPEASQQNWFAGVTRKGIYLVAYQELPFQQMLIFSVNDWKKYKVMISSIRSSVLIFTFLALVISAVIITFSAYDLSRPIEEIRNLLRKVSGGDLSRELDLISESEVGDISVSLKQTVHSLRDMIGRVKGSAQVMEEKIVTIRESGSGVMKGIEVQQDDAQQTFSSIDGINSSIGEIGENLELLVSSIQEISSSIYEMDALIGEVAENIGSLSQSATETNVAITQIATSVNEIKEMGEKLSRRTREAVDSMEAMEGSTRKIGESARETAKLSDRVQEDAEVGFQAVVSTIEGIGKIRDSIRETARVIEGLGERIQEIGAVLVVIDEVTEETGLLSLNAAIIAAQAGEHGRGFAVVADQIKALAERTAVSTREISELIQRVQGESRDAVVKVKDGLERVEVGVRLAKESGEALSKIVGSSQRARQMIEDIVRATADQADRSQSFYNFIAETSQMLAETTRALREQSEGAMRITEASGRMQGIAEQIDRAAHEETSGSKQIIRAIEKVNEISKYINQAQKELADSSRRVLGAVESINEVISANTLGLSRIRDEIEEIFLNSMELRELFGRFQVDARNE